MKKEIWTEIPFAPKYYININGEVLSRNTRDKKEKILSQNKNYGGYLSVGLHINKKYKRFTVHRLVALTFIENKENKEQVNHINGIKTDNRLSNLEWVTQSENGKHSFRIGLSKMKVNKDVIKTVKNMLDSGYTINSISDFTKLHRCTVRRIKQNKHPISWYNIVT